MITYFLIAQIIADGIRIAKDIYILIAPKIHRHIGLLQLSEQLRVTDAGKHIDQQIPSFYMVFRKLRKLHVLLFLKQEHLTEKLGSCRPFLEIAKVFLHRAEHKIRIPPLGYRKITLLQAGYIYMIKCVAHIDSLFQLLISPFPNSLVYFRS